MRKTYTNSKMWISITIDKIKNILMWNRTDWLLCLVTSQKLTWNYPSVFGLRDENSLRLPGHWARELSKHYLNVYTSYYECHLIKTLLRYSTDRRNGDGEAARRTIRLPPSTCRKSASLQGRVCQHGPPMWSSDRWQRSDQRLVPVVN